MIIGYARVSTQEQKIERQIDALRARGCQKIYQEKMTGTKSERPELQKMLDALRRGDTLIIESFSRLSRSTKDLLSVVDKLNAQGINLVSIKEQLDTTTATGKMMLTMLAALSQFERDLDSERTKDGLKAARARGRMGGRPKAGSEKEKEKALAMYYSNAVKNKDIASACNVSLSTLSRWIKESKTKK